jgi:hypothetical protein
MYYIGKDRDLSPPDVRIPHAHQREESPQSFATGDGERGQKRVSSLRACAERSPYSPSGILRQALPQVSMSGLGYAPLRPATLTSELR